MGYAYSSPGILLPRATYPGGSAYPEPVWASMRVYTKTLTNGQYSMPMAIDDAEVFSLVIKYATAPTTTTTIEIATDPSFADAQTLDTIAANTSTASFWSSAERVHYSGFIRVKNTSDATISQINGQKEVNTTGGVLV